MGQRGRDRSLRWAHRSLLHLEIVSDGISIRVATLTVVLIDLRSLELPSELEENLQQERLLDFP